MSCDESDRVLYLKQGFDQQVRVQLLDDKGAADGLGATPTNIVVRFKDYASGPDILEVPSGDITWQPDGEVGVIGFAVTAAQTDAMPLGKLVTQAFVTVGGVEYASDIWHTQVEETL